MSQVKLDKSLYPKKTLNNEKGMIPVTPSKLETTSVEGGLIKLYVDVHEPPEIVEMLRTLKGIYVEVKSLKAGDYVFSNIGIERKTIKDFYNSLVHGDKHIWKQIFNLKNSFERPMLIIERWDDSYLVSTKMENTIRGAIASIFLLGVSVLIIPSKGNNLKPFVDQLAYLFFSSDKKALSMRPVSEKTKSPLKKDVMSDVLSMVPGIGRGTANILGARINSLEELSKMSDEDIRKLVPRIRKEALGALRWILNGTEWKKVEKESERDKKQSSI